MEIFGNISTSWNATKIMFVIFSVYFFLPTAMNVLKNCSLLFSNFYVVTQKANYLFFTFWCFEAVTSYTTYNHWFHCHKNELCLNRKSLFNSSKKKNVSSETCSIIWGFSDLLQKSNIELKEICRKIVLFTEENLNFLWNLHCGLRNVIQIKFYDNCFGMKKKKLKFHWK